MTAYSLRQLLLQELATLVPLPRSEISLYLLKYSHQIIYRSTVPSQLSQHPEAIAQSLVKTWTNSEVQVWLTANFALDFKVSDRLIALWLEKFYCLILKEGTIFPSPSPINIVPQFFPLQYSHARCCAYLRQLKDQGLITIQGYIPSLEPYSLTLRQLLPSLNPKDQELLISLITLSDSFPHQSLKLVNTLGLAVLNFERDEGVWRHKPELRVFKALLLILAQYYLRIILETQLQVTAPVEL